LADRNEFEDSNGGFTNETKTFSTTQYHLPKMGKIETIVGVQGMHQTNVNSGEEYLIQMPLRMILVFWNRKL
jgi:iron complex outermembrane receptor protein